MLINKKYKAIQSPIDALNEALSCYRQKEQLCPSFLKKCHSSPSFLFPSLWVQRVCLSLSIYYTCYELISIQNLNTEPHSPHSQHSRKKVMDHGSEDIPAAPVDPLIHYEENPLNINGGSKE